MPLSLKTVEVQIKREQWNNRFRMVQVYWIGQIGCRCFRDKKFYGLSVSAWSGLGKERRRLIFAYPFMVVSPRRIHKKYIHHAFIIFMIAIIFSSREFDGDSFIFCHYSRARSSSPPSIPLMKSLFESWICCYSCRCQIHLCIPASVMSRKYFSLKAVKL